MKQRESVQLVIVLTDKSASVDISSSQIHQYQHVTIVRSAKDTFEVFYKHFIYSFEKLF